MIRHYVARRAHVIEDHAHNAARCASLPELGSAATGSYCLQLDLCPEWQRAGLEGQPGRHPGRVGELPSPPVVDVGVVADVAEQHLDVEKIVGIAGRGG